MADTTWSNVTKPTTTWANVAKTTTTWKNAVREAGFLLKDSTYYLLINATDKFIITKEF